jgi:hypothetical protein
LYGPGQLGQSDLVSPTGARRGGPAEPG